jgi:hypothetical protein
MDLVVLPPSPGLTEAFARFAALVPRSRSFSRLIDLGKGAAELPFFDLDSRRVMLVSCDATVELLAATLKAHRPAAFDEEGVGEILVAVECRRERFLPAVVGLGIRAVSIHDVIANVVGLPRSWRETQGHWVGMTLDPVKMGGSYRTAKMRLLTPDGTPEPAAAQDWLDERMLASARREELVYVRAEAGKGKSTLLADTARRAQALCRGPLTLFVPLRNLRRGAGASWLAIAEALGVVGPGPSELLAKGVQSGLIALLLDGLDEVSGRYEPTVVAQFLDVAFKTLVRPESRVVVSGRTTEATLLDPRKSTQVGLDLPETFDPEFRTYAGAVVDDIVPEWPLIAQRVPEPPLDASDLEQRPLTPADKDHILDWLELAFDDFGKDRSLFFVQSLTCIGRTRQLGGNKPLVIGGEPADCSIYEASILAAALACVREQDKIEAEARGLFTPVGQLDVLCWYALLASSDAALRQALPSPNKSAQLSFRIDPTNQNEEFTAVLRQMTKHALLFASGEGVRVGDWRPAFLSEWIRAALLVRSWLNRARLHAADPTLIQRAVTRAQKSRVAFEALFPDLAERGGVPDIKELAALLLQEANAGSPEASENFWALVAGLSADNRHLIAEVGRPKSLASEAVLSELVFQNLHLGKEFSGELVFLVGCEFTNCVIQDVRLESVDLTQAAFSNCRFERVAFVGCDGPIRFDGCTFEGCTFESIRTREVPAWVFQDCRFGIGVRIVQSDPALGKGTTLVPVAAFGNCTSTEAPEEVCVGEWLGFDPIRATGLIAEQTAPEPNRAEECLVRLLRPFFPSWAGPGGEIQARPYIRLSAVGRGAMPEGSPTDGDLLAVLAAEGFTPGGRADHLYAPWSSVAGGRKRDLRNEMLAFLRNRTKGPAIERMLKKVDAAASWH